MKYKLFVPALALAMALCAPASAFAAEWTADMFTWDDTTPTKIAGLNDAGFANLAENTNLALPATNAAGEATTEIGNMAFSAGGGTTFTDEQKAALKTITSVTMPNTITTMGSAAFNSESALASVQLSTELTAVPTAAFLKNNTDDAAIENVVIPGKVTTIGGSAFAGAKVKTLSLSDSVTEIANYAFLNNQLSTVTLPKSVTKLGVSAFSIARPDLEKTITSITLNEGLVEIGSSAFAGANVTEVQLPTTVTVLNKYAFKGCSPTVTLLASTNAQLTATSKFIVAGTAHVVKGDMTKAKLSVEPSTVEATGAAVEPAATLTFDGTTVDAAEYALSYEGNVNPGMALVRATAAETGKFVGATSCRFSIALSADDALAADAVEAAIADLPSLDTIKSGDETALASVARALEAFNALSSASKSALTGNTLTKLIAAQTAVAELKAAQAEKALADEKAAGEAAVAAEKAAGEAAVAAEKAAGEKAVADEKAAGEAAVAAEKAAGEAAVAAEKAAGEKALAEQKAAAEAAAKAAAAEAQKQLEAEKAATAAAAEKAQAAEKALADEKAAAEAAAAEAQKELDNLKAQLAEALKQPQVIKAKVSSKTYSAKSVKKSAKTFALGITANGKGKLSYKVTKANSKLSFKNGKVTVKKGTKAGTYKMTLKVTADACGNYKKTTKTLTITVKVK